MGWAPACSNVIHRGHRLHSCSYACTGPAMSFEAVDFLVDDDVPPGPDHLRILDALEEYHAAVITCCRRFGRRRYARAARKKVRYLEILQE